MKNFPRILSFALLTIFGCSEPGSPECTADADCTTAGLEVCDTSSGTCEECTSADASACEDSNDCTQDACTANSCTNTPLSGNACDLVAVDDGVCDAGTCVASCTNDSECDADTECTDYSCNLGTGLCEAAHNDTSTVCDLGASGPADDGFCDGEGGCVECSTDANCDSNPAGEKCDVENNACVECLEDTQCTSLGAPLCVDNECDDVCNPSCAESFMECAPDNTCHTGAEGDPCATVANCFQSGGGSEYCGPDERCHDGSTGDPCSEDSQCEHDLCASNGMCQIGIDGDFCATADDCSTNIPHYCGPDSQCHDGTDGDPCNTSDDCIIGTCTGSVCTT